MKKIIITLVTLCLVSGVGHAVEPRGTHKQKTAPLGRVYMFMPMNYSFCFDEMYFISEVANIPSLEAGSTRIVVEKYMKKSNDDDPAEIARMAKSEPRYSEEEIRQKMSTLKRFKKKAKPIPVALADKYGVTDFPSFIYLAPDLNVYHFPFKGCGSTFAVNQFKSLLEDFRTGKRLKKDIWDLGNGSQVPSRF